MRELQDGDIVNIDISTFHRGYHGDLNEVTGSHSSQGSLCLSVPLTPLTPKSTMHRSSPTILPTTQPSSLEPCPASGPCILETVTPTLSLILSLCPQHSCVPSTPWTPTLCPHSLVSSNPEPDAVPVPSTLLCVSSNQGVSSNPEPDYVPVPSPLPCVSSRPSWWGKWTRRARSWCAVPSTAWRRRWRRSDPTPCTGTWGRPYQG